MYSFKCGNHSENKLRGVSKPQSNHINFEEYKNCLYWKKYQEECENSILRSINHEMYLRAI